MEAGNPLRDVRSLCIKELALLRNPKTIYREMPFPVGSPLYISDWLEAHE